MKDPLLQIIKKFLERHCVEGKSFLVGCSGGADSLALLHLLAECRRFFSLDIHVAHIDHSWRDSSASEAEELALHVKKMGLPFHLHTLEKGKALDEDGARNARYAFFLTLYRQWGCQALLLGHHADDQAETVLKRVLEGASLSALGGIRQISTYHGMQVARPLLEVSKKNILLWCERKGLTPIDDPTNYDPKYLRSRMRVKIVPDLEAAFGKKVAPNLVRLGALAEEMQEYLLKKSPFFEISKKNQGGDACLDFNPYYPLDPLELKIFLKHILAERGLMLSFRSLNVIQKLLESRSSRKVVDSVIVENGILYLTNLNKK